MTTTEKIPPRRYFPDDRFSMDVLCPGDVVLRWTETTDAGVWAQLPCHELQQVKFPTPQPGDVSNGGGVACRGVAVCRSCSTTFNAYLIPDPDGGFWGGFDLADMPYYLSKRRT